MKKNRIYFGLLILALVVTIVWTSAGMLGVNKEEKKYSVSVIANDSNNDRWIAMREGLEQAAKDDDIQLNYVSTGVFASEDEEKALIEREVENGADGIIVQLVSSEDTYAVFEKIDSSVAVMLLETDAVSEGVYSVTAPDNLWIGEALAQTVLQDYGDSLSEKKIGILSGNQNQLSMQQRLGSVKKLLEDENIEPVWILSGQGENLSSELVTKQADEPVDILICGSITKSRDVNTQAVFSLRGKPLNSYGLTKKVVYENEEFNLLQAALNIEDGIETLRYNKVIVATDADVDGMHIRLLIITFFLQFFPDLIKKGHVYILQTPLFRVRNKKKTSYCYTEEERVKAIEELGPNPEITRFKGLGEISPDEFKHFIGKDMRLEQVSLRKTDLVKELLEFYMGKNTMERQNFIINNLVIEEDLAS